MTVDSAADAVLERAGKPFRRRHLDALLQRVQERGVRTELGLIFGLPGESEETVAETIAFVRGLPDDLEVAYAVGARAYPGTPLGQIAEQEPEHLYGAPGTPSCRRRRSTPPSATRARWPASSRPRSPTCRNVERMGVGYRRSTHALSHAYRAVLAGDREAWDAALRRAAREPGAGGGAHAGGVPAHRPLARALRPRGRRGRPVAARRPAARRVGSGLLRARVVFGAMGRAQGLRRRLRTSSQQPDAPV